MFSSDDHRFMAQALRLAERGLDSASPNPRVGCVIVREGQVLGEGWHERAGAPHAEVHALQQAGEQARGATVYVTLEPCSHHGRTPPCADALIAAGVGRVVAAMRDPNPQVAGQGMARLEQAGVTVEVGLMEQQARELNIGFVSRMTRRRPWVRLKAAASLDGKTALNNGVSKWITGPAARTDVQHWRARSCAILTGIGTVLADDPQMNVREIETKRQPLRVIVDSSLKTPPSAKILAGGNVLIACAMDDAVKMQALCSAGAKVLVLAGSNGRVDLARLLQVLAEREVNELMIEAGATLNGALLNAGLVDEIVLYLAPVLMGDAARGLFALPELQQMDQRKTLAVQDVRLVGQDIRVLARMK
ncbi:MAG: bifunctional diaminohydroxyphosphoribosylaminopyrimidine deaminase/5-amino-6-(5-phosphoribosylamino)uracil reductase RibD [Hydrogenophilales bacterium]|nr:bifunctional diaminohydroxyphosphoribosylaminopyrimidine deaminase/5-amino-6-(5-phosphoribosylamino)uracil reductase RibD [Hydrogenophilales bacterium]